MRTATALIVVLFVGCGDSAQPVQTADAGVDMAGRPDAGSDLAPSPDVSAAPDVIPTVDMVTPADLTPSDIAPPPADLGADVAPTPDAPLFNCQQEAADHPPACDDQENLVTYTGQPNLDGTCEVLTTSCLRAARRICFDDHPTMPTASTVYDTTFICKREPGPTADHCDMVMQPMACPNGCNAPPGSCFNGCDGVGCGP
jgi:hypothetical protein